MPIKVVWMCLWVPIAAIGAAACLLSLGMIRLASGEFGRAGMEVVRGCNPAGYGETWPGSARREITQAE